MITIKKKYQCPLCLEGSVLSLTTDPKKLRIKREYHQCPNCRLIFVPPQYHLSPDEERRRYELHENDPSDEAYRRFLSKLTHPLKQKLRPGMIGLDFGCGPGPTVSLLLEEARVRVKHYDPYFFPEEELLDNSYDFITCTEVVEHLSKPREEFQLFKRLLNDDSSVLAIMTEVLKEGENFFDWWYINEPTHISFYTKRTFEWIGDWMGWTAVFEHPNVVIYEKRG